MRHATPDPASYPDAGVRRLLDVRDLRTVFHTPRGPVAAVDGVSLSLDRGRVLALVGESGSGKTVLSRSIMGLLPRRGVERTGSVELDGDELMTLPDSELRKKWGREVAMVFQDPMTALNPVVRIGRQITEAMRLHLDLPRGEARATALALLTSLGVPEPQRRLRQHPHELSGGLRQRVVIALALAAYPKLLLADEPTTALDVTVQAQILALLARQARERDMAMVLVTHDLGVAAGRADEIAVMYAGRIVEQAPAARLFAQVRMPYTEALLQSIPRLDHPSHTRLDAIPGQPPDLARPPQGCPFAPRCPYARDRCRHEAPPLEPLADDATHRVACWFPVGMPQRTAVA